MEKWGEMMTIPNKKDLKLWYKVPAAKWEEALPLGNGRLGAMVFGDAKYEKIQLNEDTLWSGEPGQKINKDAKHTLEKARELIFKGKNVEAEQLIEKKMVGEDCEAYQPLGDVIIEHINEGDVENFRRELDLQTAVARTEYMISGVTYKRETFVSHPDQVLVVRVKALGQESFPIRLRIHLDSLHPHVINEGKDESLILSGKSPISVKNPGEILYDDYRGLKFQVHIQGQSKKGERSISDGALEISGENEVMLLLTAKTNFINFHEVPKSDLSSIETQCQNILFNAKNKGYEKLKNFHINDYQRLFNRVSLSLDTEDDYEELPTNKRLDIYKNRQDDLSLEALYFQYCRYLLISSSRPGTQAANLQGIWNPFIQPPWNSDYTTNINTEMNYWIAEVCNLTECHEPLFDLIEDLSITGKSTAKELYGARGFAVHHNVDLWRMSTPSSGQASWAFWPMAGVWLASHLWEHYLFTLDHAFLEEKAYPLMKDAAQFCLDWLIEGPDGYLVTNPSTSPENKFLTDDGQPTAVSYASTMDMTLIKELFQNCIQCCKQLNIEDDFLEELSGAIERLVPFKINKDGRLQEWIENFPEHEPGHRHVSHLYGLYPGNQINSNQTPYLVEAARNSLTYRLEHGGGHTGWSCAWLINLFARLQDEHNAHFYLQTLLARSTHPNLFDDHPPFQIDGNFGGTSGMAEMLVQSHLGEIELLPALPAAWKNGRVSGLKARGGFEVTIEWADGKLKIAEIMSTKQNNVRVSYKNKLLKIETQEVTFVTTNQVKVESNSKIKVSLVEE